MRVRTIRNLLWIVTGTMCATSVLTVLWAAGPPTLPRGGQLQPSSSFRVRTVHVTPMVTSTELDQIAQVNLRRPLHDPPPAPPPAVAAATPMPPLDVRLTGTIYEPGHCRAMMQLPDGSIQLKSIGENAGNARILDIQQGSATIEYFGKSLVLNVPKENSTP